MKAFQGRGPSIQVEALQSEAAVSEGGGAHDCMAGKCKPACMLIFPYRLHPEFVRRQADTFCPYYESSSQVRPTDMGAKTEVEDAET